MIRKEARRMGKQETKQGGEIARKNKRIKLKIKEAKENINIKRIIEKMNVLR